MRLKHGCIRRAGRCKTYGDAGSVGKSSKGPARSTDAPVKDALRSGVPCVMTIRSAVGRISAPRRRFPRLQKAASMRTTTFAGVALIIGCLLTLAVPPAVPEEPAASAVPKAFIDGTGPGWRTLGEADFVNVNTDPDTWTWKDGGVHCTGKPVGVTRSQKQVTNFELVTEWRHLQSGGNSGIFVWASEKALEGLKPNALPP